MRFLLHRLGFFALTLWAAITVNFFIPRLMPGDPASAMMARFHGRVNPAAIHAMEVAFGVDDPAEPVVPVRRATCTTRSPATSGRR